jgi:hypothetical protein
VDILEELNSKIKIKIEEIENNKIKKLINFDQKHKDLVERARKLFEDKLLP